MYSACMKTTDSTNSTPNDTLSDIKTSAWIQLARAYHEVFSSIEHALKTAGFPALSWYDVLLELDRAGTDGLRAFELQEKLLLPQYGISRLIGRIERAGYLKRIHCEDDGRSQHLTITTQGKVLRKKMWGVYGKVLKEKVGEKLTDKQATDLTKILKNLS